VLGWKGIGRLVGQGLCMISSSNRCSGGPMALVAVDICSRGLLLTMWSVQWFTYLLVYLHLHGSGTTQAPRR
jgi:hypothetical protein